MEKLICASCNKKKNANQFTKTDNDQVCVGCKQKAIKQIKNYLKKY